MEIELSCVCKICTDNTYMLQYTALIIRTCYNTLQLINHFELNFLALHFYVLK
jgi:hypothetical protein